MTAKTPVSTYRIQVRQAFDLQSVADLAGYLAELGVDWAYLSPLLEAEPGSDHGYDVIRHDRIDPARGGDEGLVRASAALRAVGLGVLIDIVPNHVGVATPALNPWWWDLLKHGQASQYAEAFDVDWAFGQGKLRIPVLGDGDEDLSKLEITRGPDGDELTYYDNRFPIAPGTAPAGATAVEVHAAQAYELMSWRRADADLNYRRFFAVNSLAGIRVEVPWVFDESHKLIGRWIADGLADGLRIDHPDGLAEPGDYLARLAELTGDAYVLVEKIVEGDELLPDGWATAGTTGYDALGEFDRVLVDPAGEAALNAIAARLAGASIDWHDLIHDTKRAVADGILKSEVLRLVRLGDWPPVSAAAADTDLVTDAMAELLTCFPVYRSYLPQGRERLDEAAAEARTRRPELTATIDAIVPVLADPANPVARRFQQTSGMVMAKGVEDSAFYRYTRLTSLTEVGGEPNDFAMSVARFHERQARRQELWPLSMTTLSTHDTKRGEDVRARIDVLAEVPGEWDEAVDALEDIVPIGDGAFANLFWQATVGAWPIERDRLHAYAEKAAREAGVSTTYTAPNEEFESRIHAVVDAVYDDDAVHAIVERIATSLAPAGWSNSLSMKLLQLTGPGVPDVYQGSELWEMSLVDPDNRRAIDYVTRRALLAAINEGAQPIIDETGAAKLLVTSRALRLRRTRPELFTDYIPLEAEGVAAGHLVAFDRGGAITLATRLPIALAERGGWDDTTVDVGSAPVLDVLTGREYQGGALLLADVLRDYPVALLVENGGKP